MNGASPIKKRTNYFLPSLFLTIMLCAAIYLTRNWLTWQKEMKVYKSTKINSKIMGLRNLKRGNYLIQLHIQDTIAEFDLPIAFEVERDSIRVGDSLSKSADAEKSVVYRIGNDKLPKVVSEFLIH